MEFNWYAAHVVALDAPRSLASTRWINGTQRSRLVDERLDFATVSAPATGNRLNRLRNDFGLFDVQMTTDGVVMEGAHRSRFHDVKTCQIAAGVAAISSRHLFTVLEVNGSSLAPTLTRVIGTGVEIESIGFLKAKHCVERYCGGGHVAFRIDQPAQGSGVTYTPNRNGPESGFEHDDATSRESLTDALIDARGKYVTPLH